MKKFWDIFFKKWKKYFIFNLGYESDYEGDVEVLSEDEQYKPGLSASSEGKIFFKLFELTYSFENINTQYVYISFLENNI